MLDTIKPELPSSTVTEQVVVIPGISQQPPTSGTIRHEATTVRLDRQFAD
ncbi:MAG: hypothetical protein AAFO01_01140 [Pseudomonadota bacterium]